MKIPTSPFRTDLAMESLELNRRERKLADKLPGVRSRERQIEGFSVTSVEILDETGANMLGKPAGVYETLCLDALMRREEDAFPRACRALSGLVRDMLPDTPVAADPVSAHRRAGQPPDYPRRGWPARSRLCHRHPPSDQARTRAVRVVAPGIRTLPRRARPDRCGNR